MTISQMQRQKTQDRKARKTLVVFAAAALFGATLFGASTVVSQPAGAQTYGTTGFTHRLIPPSAAERLFAAGQSKTFDVSAWFTPRGEFASPSLRLICPVISAPSPSSKFSSITKQANSCNYTFTAKSTSTSGTEDTMVTATSVSLNLLGLPTRQTRTVAIDFAFGPASNISFNAPPPVFVVGKRSVTIDASQYASDGPHTISCGDAFDISTARIASVARNGCNYTITGEATGGVERTGSFKVRYTSSGGHSANGQIPVAIGPESAILFSPSLVTDTHSVRAGRSINIDAASYAKDDPYTISCGEATSVSSSLSSVTRADATNKPCTYTVAAADSVTTLTSARFTVPYTSTGGDSRNVTFIVAIRPISNDSETITNSGKNTPPGSGPTPVSNAHLLRVHCSDIEAQASFSCL